MNFSLTDDDNTIAKKNALQGLSLGVNGIDQPAAANTPNLGVSGFNDLAASDPHPANTPSSFDPFSTLAPADSVAKSQDNPQNKVDASKGNPFFYAAPEDDKTKQLGQFASLASLFA